MIKLSILSNALGSDLRGIALSARKLGAAGVTLQLSAHPQLRDLSDTGRRDVARLFTQEALAIVGGSIELKPSGFGPKADVEQEIDRIDRAMQMVRQLSASLLLVDIGPLPPAPDEEVSKPAINSGMLGKLILPDPPKQKPPMKVERDEAFETSLEVALREVGTRADRAGCMIAWRSSLGSFSSLARAIRQVDCPWFGVDLDPVAIVADGRDIDAIVSAVGSMIHHVRARDAVRGAGGRVEPVELGSGHVDWQHLIANLKSSDFRGWISIDPSGLANLSAASAAAFEKMRMLIS
ncbi:MAG TPA: TIM barrel protein [Tepidisphaeraceae bacterium]|nr:TIM barrel protein [Tepidisphaeraceae bacterium]